MRCRPIDCMKTKLVLSLAMVGLALAATQSARAAFSLDISIGSRFPHRPPPVVVAQPPPVVYAPTPVDNCSPGVAAYPAPVVVAPAPRVIISQPVYGNYGYGYRHNDYRYDRRVAWRRGNDGGQHGRW